MPKDEEVVRNWIEVVKGWGVNERGQPSDGGFGFGKFAVCTDGRDSRFALMSMSGYGAQLLHRLASRLPRTLDQDTATGVIQGHETEPPLLFHPTITTVTHVPILTQVVTMVPSLVLEHPQESWWLMLSSPLIRTG